MERGTHEIEKFQFGDCEARRIGQQEERGENLEDSNMEMSIPSATLLAARIKEAGKTFVVEEVPRPTLGPDEVLVEVGAAGVCGTDLHYSRGEFLPGLPKIFGHEGAGVIAEVGSNVTSVKPDDHVVMHYVISCGSCYNCLQGNDNRCRKRVSIGHDVDGAFAQYMKIPARNAMKISDRIPIDQAAITGCAVSTAYHAVNRSGLKRGDTVVIFGTGGVGLHAVLWARFFGAHKIVAVDMVDAKLVAARRVGADITVNPSGEDVLEVVQSETERYGANVAIECSGSSKAMEQAIKVIKGKNFAEAGTAVAVGLQTQPFVSDFMGLREGQLMVSGDHNQFELQQIIRLLEAGKIDLSSSITHHISIGEINDGLQLLQNGREHVERIMVDRMT